MSTSDKIRLGVLLALPAALYLIPLEWLTEGGHTLCLFKNLTGRDCYGCGITRALFCLLHGDLSEAWAYNRMVVIVAPLLAVLYTKELLKIRKRL